MQKTEGKPTPKYHKKEKKRKTGKTSNENHINRTEGSRNFLKPEKIERSDASGPAH
jgi:hypothetical protein